MRPLVFVGLLLACTAKEPVPFVQEESGEEDVIVTEAKRGNHLLELPSGNYVVAGSHENFGDANNLSEQLSDLGFKEISIGYLSAEDEYFVIYARFDSTEMALEAIQHGQFAGLEKRWVLKVTE